MLVFCAVILISTEVTIVILFCRDVTKRVCVSGSDPASKESPIEPKWSSKGIILLYTWLRN